MHKITTVGEVIQRVAAGPQLAGSQSILAVVAALDEPAFDGLESLAQLAVPGRYRRFEVVQGGLFEILALVWGRGAESPLHGHNGSVCAVKVLSGQLLEKVSCGCGCRLQGAYAHGAGSVLLSCGDDFRRQVASIGGVAVSLHVYASPLGFETEPLPAWVPCPWSRLSPASHVDLCVPQP